MPPLSAFSIATCLQIQFLREVAKDIDALTVSAIRTDGPGGGNALAKAHGLFWLWTLGAYEVVRTMAQAKPCFTEDAHKMLIKEKQHLARIRMPFAKQERAGKRVPASWKELFAWGYGPDGDIIFDIAGTHVFARKEIARFNAFIDRIERDDIRLCLGESYALESNRSVSNNNSSADRTPIR